MGRHKHVPNTSVSAKPALTGGMAVGTRVDLKPRLPSATLGAGTGYPIMLTAPPMRSFKPVLAPTIGHPRLSLMEQKKRAIVLSSGTRTMAPYKVEPERKNWKPPRLSLNEIEKKTSEQPQKVPFLSVSLSSMLGGGLHTLRQLNIGKDCNDALLVQVASGQVPQLERLVCAHSQQLTDQGVLSLIGGMGDAPWDTHAALRHLDGKLQAPNATQPCPLLQEINICFCTRTTYVMTVALRRLMPQLQCIRRLPVWMTGEDVTPFAKSNRQQEVHKYWADGSFSFSRPEPGESRGFVQMIQKGDSGVVREALQYIDYSSDGEWPRFAEYCYRPGIAVKRADGLEEEDTYASSIYVWEPCQGMRAPARFDADGSKANVPKGKMAVVKRDGSKVPGADPDDEHPGCLVLSHMIVRPLPPGELMPPSHVVDANVRYILREEDPSLDQLAAERLVHRDMGGSGTDDAEWTKISSA